MPLLAIRHVTTYRYAAPVAFGEHRLMCHPRADGDVTLLDARLDITPAPARLRSRRDAYGNRVTVVEFAERAAELRFESRMTVHHVPIAHDAIVAHPGARRFPVVYPAEEAASLRRFLQRPAHVGAGEIERWARGLVPASGIEAGELLAAMTTAIRQGFSYRRRLAGPAQSPAETLRTRSGSCRDFAVLMMDAARSLGFAARFASGYLHVPGGDEREHVGGGATHAWVQVRLPGAGWVDYDPTNAIVGNRDLIRVAVARDPRQATPLWGTWSGSASDYLGMNVEVSVRKLEGVAAGSLAPA